LESLRAPPLSHSVTDPADLAALHALCARAEAALADWEAAAPRREVEELEVDFLEKETASQLGIAGALALALTVLHSAAKTLLPARLAGPLVGGMWALGGAFMAVRVAAGAVAGWAGVATRNARRKRRLRAKLERAEAHLWSVAEAARAARRGKASAGATEATQIAAGSVIVGGGDALMGSSGSSGSGGGSPAAAELATSSGELVGQAEAEEAREASPEDELLPLGRYALLGGRGGAGPGPGTR
jgi:hypothetical protein